MSKLFQESLFLQIYDVIHYNCNGNDEWQRREHVQWGASWDGINNMYWLASSYSVLVQNCLWLFQLDHWCIHRTKTDLVNILKTQLQ